MIERIPKGLDASLWVLSFSSQRHTEPWAPWIKAILSVSQILNVVDSEILIRATLD